MLCRRLWSRVGACLTLALLAAWVIISDSVESTLLAEEGFLGDHVCQFSLGLRKYLYSEMYFNSGIAPFVLDMFRKWLYVLKTLVDGRVRNSIRCCPLTLIGAI